MAGEREEDVVECGAVHLEVDVLAKYVDRLLAHRALPTGALPTDTLPTATKDTP